MTRAIDQLTEMDRDLISELRHRIETRGHFQGGTAPTTRTCLVINSPLSGWNTIGVNRILAAIEEAAGIESVTHPKLHAPSPVIAWQDTVTTDEVLDVLAALEVG